MTHVHFEWTQEATWDHDFTPEEWKFAVEQLDENLPTDTRQASVSEVKEWLETNREVSDQFFQELEHARKSSCVNSLWELNRARTVDP